MKKNGGFTLIELLLYVAIFAMVSGMFTGILVVMLRVQGQQSGLVEVSNQLAFAMNRIQGMIRESNPAVAPVVGDPPSSLTLSIAGSSKVISLSGNEIRVDGVPITTSKIKVDALKFTKYTLENPSIDLGLAPVHTIEIEITISNSDPSPQNKITRTLKGSASAIAK
ncbi:MAG: Cell wall surface anchor family protein [Parcubacteria group bacterium Gr01-1014_19]|nr:MAG: Cell wall surface anchor family protein [Parcubacteria group bacterium Gr01-1014_19]